MNVYCTEHDMGSVHTSCSSNIRKEHRLPVYHTHYWSVYRPPHLHITWVTFRQQDLANRRSAV